MVIDPTVDPEEAGPELRDVFLNDFGDDKEDLGWTTQKSRKNKQKERKAGGKGLSEAKNSGDARKDGPQANGNADYNVSGKAYGSNAEGSNRGSARGARDLSRGNAGAAVGNRFENLQQQGAGDGFRGSHGGNEQDPFARPAVPADRTSTANAPKPQQQQQPKPRPPRRGRNRT